MSQNNLNILKQLQLFIKNLSGEILQTKQRIQDAKEAKKENVSIGVDDVQNEYKRIPTRAGIAIFVVALITMMIVAGFALQTKMTESADNRLKIIENVIQEPEFNVSIDEQGWKHFQSKRIDILAIKTEQEINATKMQISSELNATKIQLQNDNLLIQKIIKEELNTTINSVKQYVDDIGTKLEDVKSEISKQLNEHNVVVDNKIENNKQLIQDFQEKVETTVVQKADESKTPLFDNDSKLLPPPLNSLNTLETTIDEEMEKNKKEAQDDENKTIAPDDDAYDYTSIDVDNIEVAVDTISTAIYDEANASDAKKLPPLHIMKGIVRATLITGVNAPTFGGGSEQNPAPVLLSIDGDTIIANDNENTIDNCLVAGSATGNVNTSKADVLLTEISCSGHNKNGDSVKIEQDLKGWVIGEDGSFGLSGRIIDSSGKVITKMIALEIIQGMNAAMLASAQPSGTMGTLTTTTAPTYPQAAQTGFNSGVGKGLDHAYEHYDQVLSGMYPTISILAGKKISILLKGGEDITPKLYRGVDIDADIEIQEEE